MDLKPQTEIGLRAELQIKKLRACNCSISFPCIGGELVLSFYSQKECIVLGLRFRVKLGKVVSQ